MDASQINWHKKIAENQQFRSTWIATIDGKKVIVKKITCDDHEKIVSLEKNLRRQVRFSEILNDDEKKKICLFDTMVEDSSFVAFVREWKDGVPLDDFLEKKHFTVADSIKLILDIARIVQMAHAHNVAHGDLKPANIIINNNGEVSIIDWDTMIINESVDEHISAGRTITMEQVVGTPQYMPIEQFQGHKIDQQCDIYSLGVILYQILTGKTPFDSAGPQTAAKMAIFKQYHEPESILVKHPELGVPSDLAKIIDESLKNDRNQRIQTVDDLIQRIETIGKISASQSPVSHPSPTPEKDIPSKEKGKEHKLVLIGHTGSGKTVLAAGLYATQDKDFIVSDPGSKTQTGIHAINTKTIIEEGHWPAATSVGNITKLRFKLNYMGKEEEISFDEYAGERLAMENYDKLILGQPDGAFILLNPGGEQWHSIREKNSLLSDMKHYIDLLSKKPNKPPVALVITASDRLESDLKEFAPKFRQYVNELENSLEAHHCTYQTFEVSVSGILANQNQPQLNPQHIKDPFIWLLNQFNTKKRLQITNKSLVVAGVAIFLFCLAALGNWGREAHNISSLNKSFLHCQKNYNAKQTKSEDDIIEYRNQLVELRKSQCSQKHIGNTKRFGKCDVKCMPRFLYSKYKAKHRELIRKLEVAIDSANNEFFNRKLNDAIANANMENRKVVGWISEWMPLQSGGEDTKETLKEKCDREMPPAIERFDICELEKKFNQVIQNPDIKFPAQLSTEFTNWQSISSVLPAEERAEAIYRLTDLEKQARIAVENKHFTTLRTTLENITETMPVDIQAQLDAWANHETFLSVEERQEKDTEIRTTYLAAARRVFVSSCKEYNNKISSFSGNIDDLSRLIQDFEQFKGKNLSDVDQYDIDVEYGKLHQGIYQLAEAMLNQYHKQYHTKQMDSDRYFAPTYAASFKEKILEKLPYNERKKLEIKLDDLITKTKDEWDKSQEAIIDTFIATIQWKSALDALDEFKGFGLQNSNNPYLYKAEKKVYEIVDKEMSAQLRSFDYKEKSYRTLKELCAKIRNTTNENIKKWFYFRFACQYCAWMDSRPTHTISIDKIEAYTSFSEGAYIYKCDYRVAAFGGRITSEGNIIPRCETNFYNSWCSLPAFHSVSITCNPWDYFVLFFYPYENIEWMIDRPLDIQTLIIQPGLNTSVIWFNDKRCEKSNGYAEISFDKIVLKIYFSVTGKTIWDILEESK